MPNLEQFPSPKRKPSDLYIGEVSDIEDIAVAPPEVVSKYLSAWDSRGTLPASAEVKTAKLERVQFERPHTEDPDGNPRRLREMSDGTVALLSQKEFIDEIEHRDPEHMYEKFPTLREALGSPESENDGEEHI